MNVLIRSVSWVALGLAVSGAQAQPPSDPLDEARRRQEVAVRQIEAETRLALSEAGRLAETDRPKAIEQYKTLLHKLESANILSDERRAALTRVVRDRIRVAEAAAVSDAESAAERKAREAIQKLQKVSAEKATADRAKIKTGIESIATLRKEGKLSEAAKQAKELLAQHPDDIGVQVLNGISSADNQIAENKAVNTQTDDRRLMAMRDMDRSLILPNGDIEFPKDWKEKTTRRLKSLRLGPVEMHILQALAQPINIDFKGSRLQDVADYISTMTGVTVVIDKGALDDNQLSYDTPVTFSLKTPVATRTALRAMLNQINLTYVVRDNVINITSQPRARDMMVTKTYYIGDIIAIAGFFGGASQYGIALDQAQLAQNVGGIVEMITTSLDPMSWQGKGGNGTIGFNIPTMSLIVRQSAEVHMMIRGSFYK